jgi:hypothetical protein
MACVLAATGYKSAATRRSTGEASTEQDMRASDLPVRVALVFFCLTCSRDSVLAQSDGTSRAGTADVEGAMPSNPADVESPDPRRAGDPGLPGTIGPIAWGVIGLRGYAMGQQMAPNGEEFNPLFSLDTALNLWLWRDEGVYLFSDTRFWGQKAAPGITNSSQGAFDFSKREFDLDVGVAWNYYGNLEGRAFAYSFNNLNRGTSETHPSGYADGVGIEQRWYIGGSYPDLGLPGFDVTRANFVSLGYYPTKDMIDLDGNVFKPGFFARAYLTYDVIDSRLYVYSDTQFIATRSFLAKIFDEDAGIALRPFQRIQNVEFRLGSENRWDPQSRELDTSVYVAVRFVF